MLASERCQGTSVELGSSSCCIILFGMLFLFPGSTLRCIAPGYPASHARASRNASLILIAPPLLRKQSDRCPKQKENLKAAKKKIDLSLTKCRFLSLVHGLKIASSFCFLVDGGLLDNLGNYSVYSLSGRERELERSIALLPQCRKYGATSWLRLGNSRK